MRYSSFSLASCLNHFLLPVASCLLSAGRRPLRSGIGILCLVSVVGCTYLRPQLTPLELGERLQYGQDRFLGQLVGIALSRGHRAIDVDGQARQVLELNNSDSATMHRQFFEVQPYGDGLSEVFFLENIGSIENSKLNRFPLQVRRAIRDFLDELPEMRRSQYQPLKVRQQKMSRRMISYETEKGGKSFEFTRKVTSLEISNLYGVYPLPDGPFIFLGQEREKLSRKDFLRADDYYENLVNRFLREFRGEIKL
jgi:hypothetical protein